MTEVESCIRLLVPIAVKIPKCLLNLTVYDLYIAGIVIENEDLGATKLDY